MPGRRWRDPRELNQLGETAPEAGGTAARRGLTPRLALLEKFARGARPTAAGADATDDMARGRFKNARYDHQRLSAVEGTVREGLWRRDGRRVAPRTLLLVSIVERQRREKDFFVSIRTGCHTENEGLFSGSADSDERTGFVNPKVDGKGTEFKIAGNGGRNRQTSRRRPRLRLAR